MNIRKFFFKRSLALMLAGVMMFVLSACSTEKSRKTEEYVSSVKTLVDDSVNNTRTLKTQYDEFDCKDSQSSKAYISTLGTLADLYEQLLKLEAPDDYDDLDNQVKENAEGALSIVTEIESLVKYAFQNSDSSLYDKNIETLFNNYQDYYDCLTDLSSQVHTRYRNS